MSLTKKQILKMKRQDLIDTLRGYAPAHQYKELLSWPTEYLTKMMLHYVAVIKHEKKQQKARE